MHDDSGVAVSAYDIQADDGLLFGCVLDGEGGAQRCNWTDIATIGEAAAPLWLHLDHDASGAKRWLREQSGIPPSVVGALLARESRPRSMRVGNGLLIILRGLNLNPGAEPEDMVAIRMWVTETKIVSVRHERLLTPRDVLADLLDHGRGPATVPALFVALAERLSLRMNDVILDLEDRLDELEGQIDQKQPSELRSRLAEVRHDCVRLRRYLSPQREALSGLQYDPPDWLLDTERMGLRETADRTMRYLEDMDAARDRAVVVLDELSNKMTESMNRTMYALSIVAAIFLPLSFLTGLLGINVDGVPGKDNALAFWVTCAIMGVLMVIEIIILRRLKWI